MKATQLSPPAGWRRYALAVLVTALVVAPVTAGASHQFSDVPDSHPFHDEISWLADQGITTGFPDGTFRPSIAVTRQAMAAFLKRLAEAGVVDAATLDGFEPGALAEGYCAFHTRHPRSYPAGPCQTYLTTVDSTGTVGRFTSLAVGVDGHPIISYHDNTNQDLKVVHCTDPVCSSWDTPQTLDSTGNVGLYTSLAVGVDGNPVVSYHDNTIGDLKVVHCTNPACSSWDTPQTLDTAGDVGQDTALAIGDDGNPIISYSDVTNLDLKVVHCTNPACSSWDTPQTVDSTGDVGAFTALAIGVDGNPIISYLDATNWDLRAVHCTNPACSSWDTPQTLDATGLVGFDTALAVGVDGHPIISHWDNTNDDLRVVHCTNTACSSWDTPQTLDTPGDVGRLSSIAIGVDGNPNITYYDLTNGDLKLVQCTNPACSSWDTPQTVDTAGDVGSFSSPAIGVDGSLITSYFDVTNGDLKVARVGR